MTLPNSCPVIMGTWSSLPAKTLIGIHCPTDTSYLKVIWVEVSSWTPILCKRFNHLSQPHYQFLHHFFLCKVPIRATLRCSLVLWCHHRHGFLELAIQLWNRNARYHQSGWILTWPKASQRFLHRWFPSFQTSKGFPWLVKHHRLPPQHAHRKLSSKPSANRWPMWPKCQAVRCWESRVNHVVFR